jgi:hypothetical protein
MGGNGVGLKARGAGVAGADTGGVTNGGLGVGVIGIDGTSMAAGGVMGGVAGSGWTPIGPGSSAGSQSRHASAGFSVDGFAEPQSLPPAT